MIQSTNELLLIILSQIHAEEPKKELRIEKKKQFGVLFSSISLRLSVFSSNP